MHSSYAITTPSTVISAQMAPPIDLVEDTVITSDGFADCVL